ncbi:MAG: acyltransferase family protein [Gordonia sp. (in: high G+C Gram-positive bacteria)]|uniref:acyltransferase family protein n=1 Tax=Gordonia sp. (in: high G+C Gram-positive bacteria) TaxID=84139 RepID=UPI0039E31D3E
MPRPTHQETSYLPALDGLRALAVIFVVLYHLDVPGFSGGLLGVGMFFTLSGFLITSLLIFTREKTGGLGLKTFWVRRFRRLMPAVVLVLTATLITGAIAVPKQFMHYLWEALSALLYANNWYTILSNSSYFDRFEGPSPLSHMWSLSIEEQFYLVWPLLLALMYLVIKHRVGMTLITVGLALGSFWLLYDLSAAAFDNTRAYEGTDTRAGGLLLGAAMAFWWPARKKQLSQHKRTLTDVIGLTGLGVIVLMVVKTADNAASLYSWGLPALTLATMAVLAAAVVPDTLLSGLLSLQPLRWIGERSYGIYLWHMPVIAFVPLAVRTESPWLGGVLTTTITLVLANLSWKHVEDPIRRRGFVAAITGRTRGEDEHASPATAPPATAPVAESIGSPTTASRNPGPRSPELQNPEIQNPELRNPGSPIAMTATTQTGTGAATAATDSGTPASRPHDDESPDDESPDEKPSGRDRPIVEYPVDLTGVLGRSSSDDAETNADDESPAVAGDDAVSTVTEDAPAADQAPATPASDDSTASNPPAPNSPAPDSSAADSPAATDSPTPAEPVEPLGETESKPAPDTEDGDTEDRDDKDTDDEDGDAEDADTASATTETRSPALLVHAPTPEPPAAEPPTADVQDEDAPAPSDDTAVFPAVTPVPAPHRAGDTPTDVIPALPSAAPTRPFAHHSDTTHATTAPMEAVPKARARKTAEQKAAERKSSGPETAELPTTASPGTRGAARPSAATAARRRSAEASEAERRPSTGLVRAALGVVALAVVLMVGTTFLRPEMSVVQALSFGHEEGEIEDPMAAGHTGPVGPTLPAQERRTSCDTVIHVGDSTSLGMNNPGMQPNPAVRIAAQYRRVGARTVHTDIVGGRSSIERIDDEPNVVESIRADRARGWEGCWMVNMGINDTANIEVGGVGPIDMRIDLILDELKDQPVVWPTIITNRLNQNPAYNNRAMQRFNRALIRACKRYPNLRVYDLAGETHQSWFDDGVHFTSAGNVQRARLLSTAMATFHPANDLKPRGCVLRSVEAVEPPADQQR